jgi:predicted hotdog family 3-hydroxylacyl-ACP dehydratase
MCLIDQIISWDDNELIAHSQSHHHTNNPLRNNHSLSSIIGIEYAAQTMAIHAGLLAEKEKNSSPNKNNIGGYLATIRKVAIASNSLCPPDTEPLAPLVIQVCVLMRDTQGYTYQFNIHSQHVNIISGQLTIFLVPNSES